MTLSSCAVAVFSLQVYLTVLKHGDSATLDTMLKVRLAGRNVASARDLPAVRRSSLSPVVVFCFGFFCFVFFVLLSISSTSKPTCRRRRTASSESSAPSRPPTSSRKSSASPSRYLARTSSSDRRHDGTVVALQRRRAQSDLPPFASRRKRSVLRTRCRSSGAWQEVASKAGRLPGSLSRTTGRSFTTATKAASSYRG